MPNLAPKSPHDFSESGFSLMSVLVAMAIIAIMTPIFFRGAVNQIEAHAKVANLGEMEDLRRYIRLAVDCNNMKTYWETVAKPKNQPMPLLNRENKHLFPVKKGGYGYTYAGWTIRATGLTKGLEFPVYVKKGKDEEKLLFRDAPGVICP